LLRQGMRKLLKIMVGDRGLEPLTSPVCRKRWKKLRYRKYIISPGVFKGLRIWISFDIFR
jgi:hypothetical protein